MIGKDKKRIMVTLSQSTIDELKDIGATVERPVSCLVREAVREWIQRRTPNPDSEQDQNVNEAGKKKKHHKKKRK